MSRQRRHATVITIVASLLIVPATAAAARTAGPPANDNRATPTSVEGLPAMVFLSSKLFRTLPILACVVNPELMPSHVKR